MKYKLAVATLILGFSGNVLSDVAYKWVFKVQDEQNNEPISGLNIALNLVDGRNGSKQEHTCVTTDAGQCEITASVTNGGFLGRTSSAQATFSIQKSGYQNVFKSSGSQLNKTTKEVLVLVNKNIAPTSFSVTNNTGQMLEGAHIHFQGVDPQGSSKVLACSTDASGICSVNFPLALRGLTGYALKDGYYAVELSNIDRKAVLFPLLTPSVKSAAEEAKLTCNSKDECEKVYSLAQIYLTGIATSKIQFSNDTITETYNPKEFSDIGGKVTKIPSSKNQWEVQLELYCSSNILIQDRYLPMKARHCDAQILKSLQGFSSYINQRVK